MPKVVHGSDDDVWVQTFGTGHASLSLHSAAPSDEQRAQWSRDDELRDRRRSVPFGFRATPTDRRK